MNTPVTLPTVNCSAENNPGNRQSTTANRGTLNAQHPTPNTPPVNRPRIIYSRNNIHIRHIRELQQRAEREKTGKFFVTGLRFVIQAAQQGAQIESLVVAPKLLTNVPGQRLVRKLRQAGVTVYEVPPETLHSISLVDDPQGIGAVVRQHWQTLDMLKPGKELCWIALDTVQSPGNLGTILRSCDAVGCGGVILLGDSTDPYEPCAVRASMGALFKLKFVRATPESFLTWKQKHGCTLVGTSPHIGNDYQKVNYPAPVVLFMGGERKGLSGQMQALCDRMVKIPMVGTSDSLNLAIATSVLLYEVFNQSRRYNKSVE